MATFSFITSRTGSDTTEAVARLLGRAVHDLRLSKSELEELLGRAGFRIDTSFYRYLLPRNLNDLPRIRSWIDKRAEIIYSLDAKLTTVSGLRRLSTTVNAACTKIT